MKCALLALLLSAPPAATYQPEARVEYLKGALEAVRATPPKTREQAYKAVVTLEATTCASQFDRLKVECLMSSAAKWCKKRPKAEAASCPLLMDVVIGNVLAEKEHLTRAQRYEIMRAHKDYRSEVARQIRRIQASIAADFELRTGVEAFPIPARIDRYCLARADESDLSWQSCSSVLVWFIGTAND